MGKLSLYNILKESERDMFEGFNETELTEDYPENFNFNELKKIKSYSGKRKYIQTHLGKPLGTGSARSVYRVDETKVLKLAKNSKGLAQNEVEIDWGREKYFKDILANVLDFDNDEHHWVEMELALKVSYNDFKRLWGINFKDLWIYLENVYMSNRGKGRYKYSQDEKIKEQFDENENVQNLITYMIEVEALPGDLAKINSWGRVFREDGENLVLIDFGFTNEVYQSYYT